jgi:ubiquinone/menaquinone biosynthesis C-methylase UbiE
MSIYDIGGKIYDFLILTLTAGQEEGFKKKYIRDLGIQEGDHILDWGCGTGLSLKQIIPELKNHGSLYAIDVSRKMAHRAMRYCTNTNLTFHFILRSGFDVSLPCPVDYAVASYSLGILDAKSMEMAILEIHKNLRPGGKILIFDMYLPDSKGKIKRAYNRINKLVSKRLFKQDFSETLLSLAQRHFRQINLEYNDELLAYAFTGIKE